MNTTAERTMNKAERRAEDLRRHYARLADLYKRTTGNECPNPQRLSSALLRLEREAEIETTAQCNGYYHQPTPYQMQNSDAWRVDEDQSEAKLEAIRAKVAKLFGGKLPEGFFINYDPRGYALKLKEPQGREFGYQDWGGYGILAPKF